MLTSEIIPLDPADPVPRRVRKPLPWRWIVAAIYAVMVVACLLAATISHSASFYPACLKPDGDWVHGVTKRECGQLHGRWYTASVLKKARKVW